MPGDPNELAGWATDEEKMALDEHYRCRIRRTPDLDGEVSDERDHGRKREDELLEMVKATQKLLEDRTSSKGIFKRLFGG